MSVPRERPYSNRNFLVDIGAGTEDVKAGFVEVCMPMGRVEVEQYRNGNEKRSTPRTIAPNVSYRSIVLKRGLIGSQDLYEWWNQAREGKLSEAMRAVTIQILSEDRQDVGWTVKLVNAYPVQYGFSHLDANGEGAVLEILELAYEDMQVS